MTTPLTRQILVAATVNDRVILENCLKRSPEVASGQIPLKLLEGYSSASIAYNEVLRAADPGTIVVFCHQDVYLPLNYTDLLCTRIAELEETDADWAVIGLCGRNSAGEFAGRVWSTAAEKIHQSEVPLPASVVTADEHLLIVKAGTDLFFDEMLPGFHMYGTDIIQTGLALGRTSYAIDAPAIHHDKPVIGLDRSYREAYRYMRRKWRSRLPIPNLIAPLTRSFFTLFEYDLRFRYLAGGARKRTVPTSDPSLIAKQLGLE